MPHTRHSGGGRPELLPAGPHLPPPHPCPPSHHDDCGGGGGGGGGGRSLDPGWVRQILSKPIVLITKTILLEARGISAALGGTNLVPIYRPGCAWYLATKFVPFYRPGCAWYLGTSWPESLWLRDGFRDGLGELFGSPAASTSGGLTPPGSNGTRRSDVARRPSDPTPTHARGQDDVSITRKLPQITHYTCPICCVLPVICNMLNIYIII